MERVWGMEAKLKTYIFFLDTGGEPGLLGRPQEVRGVSKYTGFTATSVGWFRVSSFPGLSSLPKAMRDAVVMASNNSVSNNTWASYNGVKKHLERCQKKWGRRFSFPMDEPQVLVFVAYFLSDTRLQVCERGEHVECIAYAALDNGIFLSIPPPGYCQKSSSGKGK